MVHGFSEHINCYNDFFPLLAAKGIQVFGWDQRGWGRSALAKPEWGNTGPTTRVIADVAAFIAAKAAANTGPDAAPLFVMGHSMGGGEICTLMADPAHAGLVTQVRGWALNAPFIGFTKTAAPSAVTVFLGRLAGRVLPRRQLLQVIPAEHLTRDAAVVAAIKADVMCHNTGTLEGLAGLLDRTSALAAGTSAVLPEVRSLWLGHGTGDLTCSYDAAIKWLDRQPVQDKTLKTYKDGYHQLHTDYCKSEFTADLSSWILERAGAPVESKL
jgi:acylglycerol lipase